MSIENRGWKRRKAVTYNTGPTINYLGVEQLNQLRNGLVINGPRMAVARNDGIGFDGMYHPGRSKRKLFVKFLYRWMYDTGDIVIVNRHIGEKLVLYYMDYRVVVEFFDTNMLLDVQFMSKGAGKEPWPIKFTREQVIERLCRHLSVQYDVSIIGDNRFVNARLRA